MSNKKTRYFVAVMGAILAVGLGTGLVASYMGLPVSVFSSAAGPEELQYVPADAAVVAYANVRDVMNSEFRQRFKDIEPSQDDKNEFEEKTGLNLEQDVDSVVAAVMPKDGMANNPAGSFLILARAALPAGAPRSARPRARRARSPNTRASASSPITTTDSNDPTPDHMAFGFLEADLVGVRQHRVGEGAIDARASNRNIVSNNEMMKLVNEIDNANAWAVGKFDAIAEQGRHPERRLLRRCRASRGSRRRVTSTAASAASFKAEAKDEATAKNLRDVMGGFLAMAKMQAGNKPGMQQLADSLVLSGDGNTVALAFSIPTEVLDVLEGLAKGRHPQLQQ